jgi:hypothetical protein
VLITWLIHGQVGVAPQPTESVPAIPESVSARHQPHQVDHAGVEVGLEPFEKEVACGIAAGASSLVGMNVDLQVGPECPNEQAAAQLHIALVDIGLPDTRFRTTVIEHQAEAERRGFTGSPTFLLDGTDPFSEPDRPIGLGCRVYHRADGPAGVPSLADLRQALNMPPPRSPH